MCQRKWTDVPDSSKGRADGQTDKWTDKEASGAMDGKAFRAADGKASRAADGKVSRAMDAGRKVSRRAARAGVPLTGSSL